MNAVHRDFDIRLRHCNIEFKKDHVKRIFYSLIFGEVNPSTYSPCSSLRHRHILPKLSYDSAPAPSLTWSKMCVTSDFQIQNTRAGNDTVRLIYGLIHQLITHFWESIYCLLFHSICSVTKWFALISSKGIETFGFILQNMKIMGCFCYEMPFSKRQVRSIFVLVYCSLNWSCIYIWGGFVFVFLFFVVVVVVVVVVVFCCCCVFFFGGVFELTENAQSWEGMNCH